MSFQKVESDSYCVCKKHYSGTKKNIVGEITFNKKTGREIKFLAGQCSICDRKNCIIVSDNTTQVEGLVDFKKNLDIKGVIIKKDGKKCFEKPWKSFGGHS